MSWYRFIASDKEPDEYCVGIQKYGNSVAIENEDSTLYIYNDPYEGYPELYTDLRHIVGIQFGKYECVKAELLDYLKKAAELCGKLEVWSIWLDDPDQDIQVRQCKGDEISESDAKWIFGREFFEHPQCLKIYKWKK